MENKFIQNTCDYEGACKILDCGEATIRRLCKQGELSCVRHGRKVRIFLDSIDDYIERVHKCALQEAQQKRMGG